MTEKIKAQLKAKFPGVNLSNDRLNAIADRLSKKITDEAQIAEKLDEFNELMPLADIAREDDRMRTLEAQSKKPAQQQPSQQQPQTEPPADDTPAWAKSLIQEVQTLKAEKAQTSIQQKLSTHEKLKGIPAVFYKGRSLPKEEELDSFVEAIATDYTAFKQETAQTIPADGRPASGLPAATATAIDAQIDAWAKKDA